MRQVLDSTKEKLSQIKTLIEEIAHDEAKNIEGHKDTASSDESTLRYLIFQMSLKESAQHLAATRRILSYSDEDIVKMCANEDMTVREALSNAKKNMVMEMLGDFLNLF